MYLDLHRGGRYHQALEAIQVCIREGNRHVRNRYPFHTTTPTFTNRYAYFKKLDYFSTECIYSPDAYRGHARAFLKDLEAARPSAIIDIIHSGEAFQVKDEVKATQKAQSRIHLKKSFLISLLNRVCLSFCV